MNPTQTQDNNSNITIGQNENHMISVKPVIKKVSKLKVLMYLLILIIVAAFITAGVYAFQNPTSIIKKALTNLDNTKLYQINTDITYLDTGNASSTTKLNLLTKVDSSSEKLLLSMKVDMNIMNEDIRLESRVVGSDFYININEASFVEMFFGKDLINKWIYVSQKDIKNNPLGINIGSTTADNLKEVKVEDKGLELIDNGIIKFEKSKIQFEDGKMIRKNYFDIDKEKLAEYIDENIKKVSPESPNSMKESFAKTEINDAYIVTGFFDNSFKSAHLNFSFKATSSVQTMEISLKYDDLSNSSLSEKIEAPKDFTSLESIFKGFMDRSLNSTLR